MARLRTRAAVKKRQELRRAERARRRSAGEEDVSSDTADGEDNAEDGEQVELAEVANARPWMLGRGGHRTCGGEDGCVSRLLACLGRCFTRNEDQFNDVIPFGVSQEAVEKAQLQQQQHEQLRGRRAATAADATPANATAGAAPGSGHGNDSDTANTAAGARSSRPQSARPLSARGTVSVPASAATTPALAPLVSPTTLRINANNLGSSSELPDGSLSPRNDSDAAAAAASPLAAAGLAAALVPHTDAAHGHNTGFPAFALVPSSSVSVVGPLVTLNGNNNGGNSSSSTSGAGINGGNNGELWGSSSEITGEVSLGGVLLPSVSAFLSSNHLNPGTTGGGPGNAGAGHGGNGYSPLPPPPLPPAPTDSVHNNADASADVPETRAHPDAAVETIIGANAPAPIAPESVPELAAPTEPRAGSGPGSGSGSGSRAHGTAPPVARSRSMPVPAAAPSATAAQPSSKGDGSTLTVPGAATHSNASGHCSAGAGDDVTVRPVSALSALPALPVFAQQQSFLSTASSPPSSDAASPVINIYNSAGGLGSAITGVHDARGDSASAHSASGSGSGSAAAPADAETHAAALALAAVYHANNGAAAAAAAPAPTHGFFVPPQSHFLPHQGSHLQRLDSHPIHQEQPFDPFSVPSVPGDNGGVKGSPSTNSNTIAGQASLTGSARGVRKMARFADFSTPQTQGYHTDPPGYAQTASFAASSFNNSNDTTGLLAPPGGPLASRSGSISPNISGPTGSRPGSGLGSSSSFSSGPLKSAPGSGDTSETDADADADADANAIPSFLRHRTAVDHFHPYLKSSSRESVAVTPLRLYGVSCFILPPTHRVRVFLARLMTSRFFEIFVIVSILFTSVISALSDSTISQGSTLDTMLDVSDIVVAAIFTLEAVIKILALGFLLHKGSYLRSPWNIIDLCIVIFSLIYILFGTDPNSPLNNFRAFRALRPLKLVANFPRAKIIVDSITASGRSLGKVLLVGSFFYLVFAVIGVQLFKGRLNRCEAWYGNGVLEVLYGVNRDECQVLMDINNPINAPHALSALAETRAAVTRGQTPVSLLTAALGFKSDYSFAPVKATMTSRTQALDATVSAAASVSAYVVREQTSGEIDLYPFTQPVTPVTARAPKASATAEAKPPHKQTVARAEMIMTTLDARNAYKRNPSLFIEQHQQQQQKQQFGSNAFAARSSGGPAFLHSSRRRVTTTLRASPSPSPSELQTQSRLQTASANGGDRSGDEVVVDFTPTTDGRPVHAVRALRYTINKHTGNEDNNDDTVFALDDIDYLVDENDDSNIAAGGTHNETVDDEGHDSDIKLAFTPSARDNSSETDSTDSAAHSHSALYGGARGEWLSQSLARVWSVANSALSRHALEAFFTGRLQELLEDRTHAVKALRAHSQSQSTSAQTSKRRSSTVSGSESAPWLIAATPAYKQQQADSKHRAAAAAIPRGDIKSRLAHSRTALITSVTASSATEPSGGDTEFYWRAQGFSPQIHSTDAFAALASGSAETNVAKQFAANSGAGLTPKMPTAAYLDPEKAIFAWKSPYGMNFDDVPNAFLLLFEISTFEMWPQIMQIVMDGTNDYDGPRADAAVWAVVYFVLFILVGGFFVMSLFVGVVVDEYKKNLETFTDSANMTDDQLNYLEAFKDIASTQPPVRPLPPHKPVFCFCRLRRTEAEEEFHRRLETRWLSRKVTAFNPFTGDIKLRDESDTTTDSDDTSNGADAANKDNITTNFTPVHAAAGLVDDDDSNFAGPASPVSANNSSVTHPLLSPQPLLHGSSSSVAPMPPPPPPPLPPAPSVEPSDTNNDSAATATPSAAAGTAAAAAAAAAGGTVDEGVASPRAALMKSLRRAKGRTNEAQLNRSASSFLRSSSNLGALNKSGVSDKGNAVDADSAVTDPMDTNAADDEPASDPQAAEPAVTPPEARSSPSPVVMTREDAAHMFVTHTSASKDVAAEKARHNDGFAYKSPYIEVRLRNLCYNLVEHPAYDIGVIIIVVVNMVIMCLMWYDQPTRMANVMTELNDICTYLFVADLMLKFAGLGSRQYLADNWNKFDCVIIIISILPLVARRSGNGLMGIDPTIFRVFRVFRVFRLLKRAQGLQMLVQTVAFSIPSLLSVGLVLFITFFVFAILGMNIFGRVRPGPENNNNANFTTFPRAISTLFRSATGESWNGIMSSLMVQPPFCDNTAPVLDCGYPFWTPLYFVVFQVITTFLILNVFVAIVVDNFESEVLNDPATSDTPVNRDQIRIFAESWADWRRGQVQSYRMQQVELQLRREKHSAYINGNNNNNNSSGNNGNGGDGNANSGAGTSSGRSPSSGDAPGSSGLTSAAYSGKNAFDAVHMSQLNSLHHALSMAEKRRSQNPNPARNTKTSINVNDTGASGQMTASVDASIEEDETRQHTDLHHRRNNDANRSRARDRGSNDDAADDEYLENYTRRATSHDMFASGNGGDNNDALAHTSAAAAAAAADAEDERAERRRRNKAERAAFAAAAAAAVTQQQLNSDVDAFTNASAGDTRGPLPPPPLPPAPTSSDSGVSNGGDAADSGETPLSGRRNLHALQQSLLTDVSTSSLLQIQTQNRSNRNNRGDTQRSGAGSRASVAPAPVNIVDNLSTVNLTAVTVSATATSPPSLAPAPSTDPAHSAVSSNTSGNTTTTSTTTTAPSPGSSLSPELVERRRTLAANADQFNQLMLKSLMSPPPEPRSSSRAGGAATSTTGNNANAALLLPKRGSSTSKASSRRNSASGLDSGRNSLNSRRNSGSGSGLNSLMDSAKGDGAGAACCEEGGACGCCATCIACLKNTFTLDDTEVLPEKPMWMHVTKLCGFLNTAPAPLGFAEDPLDTPAMLRLLVEIDLKQYNGYIHYADLAMGLMRRVFGIENATISRQNEKLKSNRSTLRGNFPEISELSAENHSAAYVLAATVFQRALRRATTAFRKRRADREAAAFEAEMAKELEEHARATAAEAGPADSASVNASRFGDDDDDDDDDSASHGGAGRRRAGAAWPGWELPAESSGQQSFNMYHNGGNGGFANNTAFVPHAGGFDPSEGAVAPVLPAPVTSFTSVANANELSAGFGGPNGYSLYGPAAGRAELGRYYSHTATESYHASMTDAATAGSAVTGMRGHNNVAGNAAVAPNHTNSSLPYHLQQQYQQPHLLPPLHFGDDSASDTHTRSHAPSLSHTNSSSSSSSGNGNSFAANTVGFGGPGFVTNNISNTSGFSGVDSAHSHFSANHGHATSAHGYHESEMMWEAQQRAELGGGFGGFGVHHEHDDEEDEHDQFPHQLNDITDVRNGYNEHTLSGYGDNATEHHQYAQNYDHHHVNGDRDNDGEQQ